MPSPSCSRKLLIDLTLQTTYRATIIPKILCLNRYLCFAIYQQQIKQITDMQGQISKLSSKLNTLLEADVE